MSGNLEAGEDTKSVDSDDSVHTVIKLELPQLRHPHSSARRFNAKSDSTGQPGEELEASDGTNDASPVRMEVSTRSKR